MPRYSLMKTTMTTDQLAKKTGSLIRNICEQMILKPGSLKLDVLPMTQSFIICIVASYSDAKRIVGAGGVHFEALKQLVALAGRKFGINGELDAIQDDGNRLEDRYPEFEASQDWPKAKVASLFEAMATAVFEDEKAIRINIKDGSAGLSIVEVACSEAESREVIEKFRGIIAFLAKPIGKGNRRRLMVDFTTIGTSERQPASADGRFAKAISRQ